MKTVLSTKILTQPQRELFLNSGLGLVEYNAIHIDFLDVPIPLDHPNYIFTSKNAVKAFLRQSKNKKLPKLNAFCVGTNTKSFLEANGFTVLKTADNAATLATLIVQDHSGEEFLFLCGNKRREELPDILSKYNIRYKELEVYRTELNTKVFNRNFDGILFFSPSGITSFFTQNQIAPETILFCIGETTAKEANKYSKNSVIANKPTIENVLVQAIKELSIQTDAERSRSTKQNSKKT